MSYKLAIFDLDGTILNTLEDLADSLNFVCLKYNFPTFSYEEVKYMVGNGIPKLIERALPQGKDNPFYKNCLNDYISYYEKHSQIKTGPYPEMKEHLFYNCNKERLVISAWHLEDKDEMYLSL